MRGLPILEVKTSAGKRAADTDLVVVFQEGSAKKAAPPKGAYQKTVSRLVKAEAFTGKAGSTAFVRFGGKGGAANALFVGLGPSKELTAEKLRSAGGHAWQRLVAEKSQAVTVRVENLGKGPEGVRLLHALAEGLILGAYRFDKHRGKAAQSKTHPAGPSRIIFVMPKIPGPKKSAKDGKALQSGFERAIAQVAASAEAVTVTRDWSNEPSNHGTPEYFASEAKRLAKEHGIKCTVLSEKDAEKEKMGLFLGVGQGSEREGKIVVLEYAPPKSAEPESGKAKTIALVGKGVTFDSGGISIKPSLRMEDMKHDMTGAATVMGATLLAASMKVPHRVVAILAFTENMPDGHAIQPGNVITGRSGKTVEVNNTDAEGRLILADVLDYAHDFKPDAIIDVATLTGAVSVALGKYCCGIMGNDEGLIAEIRRVGEETGERIWQLPLFDEYFDDLRSDTADMKNVANDANGGAIRGGMFLKQFIKKGQKWAHLDIAATAWSLPHLSYMPKKGASGIYVRTLARFIAELA